MPTRAETRGRISAEQNNERLADQLSTWLIARGHNLSEGCRNGVRSWMRSAFVVGIERGKNLQRRRAAKHGDR